MFQGKPPTAPPQINYLKEIIFPHKKTKEKKNNAATKWTIRMQFFSLTSLNEHKFIEEVRLKKLLCEPKEPDKTPGLEAIGQFKYCLQCLTNIKYCILYWPQTKKLMAKIENLYKGCSVPVNFFWQGVMQFFRGVAPRYSTSIYKSTLANCRFRKCWVR